MKSKRNRLFFQSLTAVLLCMVLITGVACGSTPSTAHPQGSETATESTPSVASTEGEIIEETYVGSLLPPVAKSTTLGNDASVGLSGLPTDLGKGTTYYISSSMGDDDNDGLSEETPFRTVEAISSIDLSPGDNVLLKRGDVFEGTHMVLKGTGKDETDKWITVDAYGEGSNPLLRAPAKASPAISLNRSTTTGGYRIRHIDIDGYVQGISVKKSTNDPPFDGLIISDCTIQNITLHKFHESSDYDLLPGGAALAFGIWLYNVENATVTGVTFYNTDCPIQVLGGNVTLSDLDICKSNMQGIMLYGAVGDLDYDTVMATTGHITVKDTRILHTGDKVGTWGSTGILMENLHDGLVQNVEIGYTVNGLAAYDAVAMDWEQSNVNCVIEDVYAHDNQGAMLLAMEHGASEGNSRGNVVRRCVSLNNGLHGSAEVGTLINVTSYHEPEQVITIENCIDIGREGTVSFSTGMTEPTNKVPDKLKVSGLISGLTEVWESFDLQPDENAFSVATHVEIDNSRLSLQEGSVLRTVYSGEQYGVSAYLRGSATLVFLSPDVENGYVWQFEPGALLAQKRVNGQLQLIERIALPEPDTNEWFRVRVETQGELLETYINDQPVSILRDNTYTSGAVALEAMGDAEADLLMVWEYTEDKRLPDGYNVRNELDFGSFGVSSQWHTTEDKWQPEAMSEWLSRPHGAGWGRLSGREASVSRQVDIDVTGYDKVQLVLMNGTESGRVRFEFSKDGGDTWHSISLETPYAGGDHYWQTPRVPFAECVVDLEDIPQWTGKITNLRLCFEGTTGQVAVKNITIYK